MIFGSAVWRSVAVPLFFRGCPHLSSCLRLSPYLSLYVIGILFAAAALSPLLSPCLYLSMCLSPYLSFFLKESSHDQRLYTSPPGASYTTALVSSTAGIPPWVRDQKIERKAKSFNGDQKKHKKGIPKQYSSPTDRARPRQGQEEDNLQMRWATLYIVSFRGRRSARVQISWCWNQTLKTQHHKRNH